MNEHSIVVATDHPKPRPFYAICDCGWQSSPTVVESEAWRRADAHVFIEWSK